MANKRNGFFFFLIYFVKVCIYIYIYSYVKSFNNFVFDLSIDLTKDKLSLFFLLERDHTYICSSI